jgi:hypothetical protein
MAAFAIRAALNYDGVRVLFSKADWARYPVMVTTLGEALDAGWRLHIRCAWGRRA